MPFKASAPGSLMLMGEYAVVAGAPAIACALDKRITVTLTPRTDQKIFLHSALGEYETSLAIISIAKPFEFVLATILSLQHELTSGFELLIEADFSHEVGFASSSAVTVATLAALNKWRNKKLDHLQYVQEGRRIIQHVQKRGSGTDIAAAVFGGIIAYYPKPLAVRKFALTPMLSVLYCGYKTTTVTALQLIQKKFAEAPREYKKICDAIAQCVVAAEKALEVGDWHRFGELMVRQQECMVALGVNNADLQALLDDLSAQPDIVGAKISGSGLGDCVVGLGAQLHHPKRIPVTISLEGMRDEEV